MQSEIGGHRVDIEDSELHLRRKDDRVSWNPKDGKTHADHLGTEIVELAEVQDVAGQQHHVVVQGLFGVVFALHRRTAGDEHLVLTLAPADVGVGKGIYRSQSRRVECTVADARQ
jgi:hypothetical protein